MPTIEIYKRTQGKYTRICTFAAGVLIGAIGALLLGEKLAANLKVDSDWTIVVQYGVPVVLAIALAAGMFWLVNRSGTADFLIATEGEMKKVSWSNKKEIIGSTKVVIITMVLLAMILLAVDLMFAELFKRLGVMG